MIWSDTEECKLTDRHVDEGCLGGSKGRVRSVSVVHGTGASMLNEC